MTTPTPPRFPMREDHATDEDYRKALLEYEHARDRYVDDFRAVFGGG